jgi:hypothetical protein
MRLYIVFVKKTFRVARKSVATKASKEMLVALKTTALDLFTQKQKLLS